MAALPSPLDLLAPYLFSARHPSPKAHNLLVQTPPCQLLQQVQRPRLEPNTTCIILLVSPRTLPHTHPRTLARLATNHRSHQSTSAHTLHSSPSDRARFRNDCGGTHSSSHQRRARTNRKLRSRRPIRIQKSHSVTTPCRHCIRLTRPSCWTTRSD